MRITHIILCVLCFVLGMMVDSCLQTSRIRDNVIYQYQHREIIKSPNPIQVRLKAIEHESYIASLEK